MKVTGGQELFDATEQSYLDQIAHYAKEVAVRDVRITQLERALNQRVTAQNAKPDELPNNYPTDEPYFPHFDTDKAEDPAAPAH